MFANRQELAASTTDAPDASAAAAVRAWPGWLGLAVMAVVALTLSLLERQLTATWPYRMEDFNVFRMGGRLVLHGGPLYHTVLQSSGLQFTYTPLAAVLFAPLALGPAGGTAVVWCGVELLMLEGTAWLALGAVGVRRNGVRTAAVVPIAAGSILLDPVSTDIVLGQINLLLMLLVLADLLLGEGRRWQGVGIGAAAAIKLVPLLFIVYLAVTRRWRAAWLAVAVFVLGLGIGFAVEPSASAEYWRGDGYNPSRVGVPQSPFNQSLRAVFARLLHTDATANPVWLLVAVLVAAGGLYVSVRLYRRGELLSGAVACALTSTLVSPVAWEHHWVWVVPLLTLLGARAVRGRSPGWAALTVLVALAYGLRLLDWFVPVGDSTDLHLSFSQQLSADTFPLAGLVVLAIFAATSRGPVARPGENTDLLDSIL